MPAGLPAERSGGLGGSPGLLHCGGAAALRSAAGAGHLRLFVPLWPDSGASAQDPHAKSAQKPADAKAQPGEIRRAAALRHRYPRLVCPAASAAAGLLQVHLSRRHPGGCAAADAPSGKRSPARHDRRHLLVEVFTPGADPHILRVRHCGACLRVCPMDIRAVGDSECVHCGKCIDVCRFQAISFRAGKLVLRGRDPSTPPRCGSAQDDTGKGARQ